MGWIDGVLSSGFFAKIAAVLLVADMFFNWIAFCSTSWGVVTDTSGASDDVHVGLWRRCQAVTRTCYMLDGYAKVWFGICQGLAVLAWAAANAACAMMMFFIFFDGCKRNKELGQAAAFTCVISAVLWLIVVVMFGELFSKDTDVSGTGDSNDKAVGFSFTLAIFALLIEAIAGVFLLIDALQRPANFKKGHKHRQLHAETKA